MKGHGVTFDANGRLVSGTGGYVLLSDACFVEQMSHVESRVGIDGETYQYSIVVHMADKTLPKRGDTVRLTKADGTFSVECVVKDAWYYTNIGKAKIWV